MDWDKELVMLPDGILEQGIVLNSIRMLKINMTNEECHGPVEGWWGGNEGAALEWDLLGV